MSDEFDQYDESDGLYGELPEDDEDFLRPKGPRRKWLIVGLVTLAFLIIVGGVSSALLLRQGNTKPTPTVSSGNNSFFFLVSPPWSRITIDGHMLAHIPTPGSGSQPMQLSPGIHSLVWQASPFQPRHCTLYVSTQFNGQSCLNANAQPVYNGPNENGTEAWLLQFNASTTDFSTSELDKFYHAAQAALSSLDASATVQSGEHVRDNAQSSATTIAHGPLKATLHFQLQLAVQVSSGSCWSTLIDSAAVCQNDGEYCGTLCPLFDPVSNVKPSTKYWEVLAPISPIWSYTRPQGQPVPPPQGGTPEPTPGISGPNYLIPMYITWDGSSWHITVKRPADAPGPVAMSPACDEAQYFISQDSRFVSVAGTSQGIVWKYFTGNNPAEGCLAEAFAQSGTNTQGTPIAAPDAKPLARCLFRFGVLLALDDTAHRSWPDVMMATPYEQSIGQQIASQAHG